MENNVNETTSNKLKSSIQNLSEFIVSSPNRILNRNLVFPRDIKFKTKIEQRCIMNTSLKQFDSAKSLTPLNSKISSCTKHYIQFKPFPNQNIGLIRENIVLKERIKQLTKENFAQNHMFEWLKSHVEYN